jgi:leucyl aminopeptidase
MEITFARQPLPELAADWLILGVWENEPFSAALQALDGKLNGLLARLKERGDSSGKAKELIPLLHPAGIPAARLMLAGLGQRGKADMGSLIAAASAATRAITSKAYDKVAVAVPENAPGLSGEASGAAMGLGVFQGSEGPGLRKSKTERFAPKQCILASASLAEDELKQAVRRVDVEGRAVSLARELVNLPPNDLYPESFADRARQAAQKTGLEIIVLDEQQLAAERMGALLAVARGSDRPPRLVVLRYQGAGQGKKTLALIGKGVTFDSGGLSLKTTEQMVDMKCDMAGAAAVLAAMQAAAELALPVNLIGVMALVENLPSGKAMKLGDVLRARNGKTIEVLNTDAEGRLILADALAYAVDQKASHLVDLATLTGACMVALGTEVAGLMGNDEAWSQTVLDAAKSAGEKAWPLPMWPFYSEMIKSDVADMKNTGGSRYAGAISAAKLLEEFVAGVPWAHLDIAGPAWAERETAARDAGGTGAFVRTLVELARRYPGK